MGNTIDGNNVDIPSVASSSSSSSSPQYNSNNIKLTSSSSHNHHAHYQHQNLQYQHTGGSRTGSLNSTHKRLINNSDSNIMGTLMESENENIMSDIQRETLNSLVNDAVVSLILLLILIVSIYIYIESNYIL